MSYSKIDDKMGLYDVCNFYKVPSSLNFQFMSLEGACAAEVEILNSILFEKKSSSPIFSLKPRLDSEVSCGDGDGHTNTNTDGSYIMTDAEDDQVSNTNSENPSNHPIEVSIDNSQPLLNGPSNNHDIRSSDTVSLDLAINGTGEENHVQNDITVPHMNQVQNAPPNIYYQAQPASGPQGHNHNPAMMQNHVSIPISVSMGYPGHPGVLQNQYMGPMYHMGPMGSIHHYQIPSHPHAGHPHPHPPPHNSQNHQQLQYITSSRELQSPESVGSGGGGGHYKNHEGNLQSPNSSSSTRYRKSQRDNRDNRKRNEEQPIIQYPPQPYNIGVGPGVGYPNHPYYNHQVQAQNLTGQPIIMPAHNGMSPQMYPYPPQQSHIYPSHHSTSEMDTSQHIAEKPYNGGANSDKEKSLDKSSPVPPVSFMGNEEIQGKPKEPSQTLYQLVVNSANNKQAKENDKKAEEENEKANKMEINGPKLQNSSNTSNVYSTNNKINEAETVVPENVEIEKEEEIAANKSISSDEEVKVEGKPSTMAIDEEHVDGQNKKESEPREGNLKSVPLNLKKKEHPSTPAAVGRSWASIASKKSNGEPSGENQTMPTSHKNGLIIDNNNVNTITDMNAYPVPSSYSNNSSSSNNYRNNSHHQQQMNNNNNNNTKYDNFTPDLSVLNNENDELALKLGEFLKNYPLDHHALALTPRGLNNQSNFCYINATLQALLSCPPFVNMFRAMRDLLEKRPCRATPVVQAVFDFVNEFDPMFRPANKRGDKRCDNSFHQGVNLDPSSIRRVLCNLEGNTFKVEGRQEDAEEFLSHLLDTLHEEMDKVIKWSEAKKEKLANKSSNSKEANNVGGHQGGPGGKIEPVEEEDDGDSESWQVMGPKNKGCLSRKTLVSRTPISEAFRGQMCSALSAKNTIKSANLQPFYTLQLDISNDNIRSLKDALENISTKEEVSGYVSNAGSELEAWRQMTLDELPIVLVLHLKRFIYDKTGHKIHKLDKKLDFGIDLEIGKELISSQNKGKYSSKQLRTYKLFAVVYHDGEDAHKGHYVADCFHPSSGSMWGTVGWLRYDDTSVKILREQDMLNPQSPRVPYLLYYRRTDTLLSHATAQSSNNNNNKK